MQYILEGIGYGLTLAILLGPIFITLTQSAIERGQKAGFSVAFGVWVSDLLFIILTYLFIQRISNIVEGESFTLYVGIIGGIILILFGVYAFLKKTEAIKGVEISGAKSYIHFFSKGFAVNTFNPFSFVFWISVISTYILGEGLSRGAAAQFLGGIFFTIVVTDILKVFLAQVLRKRLNLKYLSLINKIAGAALAIFGIILIIRSI